MPARWRQYVLGFLLESQIPHSSIHWQPHHYAQRCWLHPGYWIAQLLPMWWLRPELVPSWMGLLPRLTARSMGATRGKPPSISIPLTYLCIQTMISNFLFSNMVDFPEKDYVLQPRACKLAHMHDAFTALHISCMTFHLLVMPISQCNAQVFDCSRCLGGLAVDKRDLKAELLRFKAPYVYCHGTSRQHW